MVGWQVGKETVYILPIIIIVAGLILGFGMVVLLVWKRLPERPVVRMTPDRGPTFLSSPTRWLAIKNESMLSVQSALHLHDPETCSWAEGLSHDERLFISPSMEGWNIVTGDRIPDPSDDVDVAFRFLLNLSRELGEVQYFSANPILHYHSWIKVRLGRVIRAYAWAGQTLWNQGAITREEKELGLRTFDYGDETQSAFFGDTSAIEVNVEKVPRLAARWGLDLARVRNHLQERGIAGTP